MENVRRNFGLTFNAFWRDVGASMGWARDMFNMGFISAQKGQFSCLNVTNPDSTIGFCQRTVLHILAEGRNILVQGPQKVLTLYLLNYVVLDDILLECTGKCTGKS